MHHFEPHCFQTRGQKLTLAVVTTHSSDIFAVKIPYLCSIHMLASHLNRPALHLGQCKMRKMGKTLIVYC